MTTPRRLTAVLCAFALSAFTQAHASPPVVVLAPDETLQPNDNATGPGGIEGYFASLTRTGNMLGSLGGLRPAIAKYGLTFSLQETSEVLGNLTGGVRRGFDYDGLTVATLQLDTQRAFGLYGGTFNVSALQLHGRNLSADNLYTLQTASGIQGDRSLRLWELWYQQKFLEEDRLDIKIGQQSLDQEFMVSQNANYFVNTMFGWAMVPSADLPGGGPAYPLSALGARARYRPADSVTMLLGVFNGSPTANAGGDPQQTNPSGTSFPVKNGALVIGEVQYSYPSLGTMLYAGQSEPLARTYKLGFWYDSQRFDDLAYDDTGLSLADPNSTGNPRRHRGDFSLYATADQMLWLDPKESDRNINLFARAMWAPQQDRNLVNFSANLGLTMHEPFLGRDDDTAGLALGYAHVGRHAALLDQATAQAAGTDYPVRSSETFIEATYQYSAAPWWQIQPDLQYVFHPGGNAPNPFTGQTIRNELVIGVRTNIVF